MFWITQLFVNHETCMSIYLFQRWILHIKSIPIFQNKSIKSGFMAIIFQRLKVQWLRVWFYLGVPCGEPHTTLSSKLLWPVIGCRSAAAKVVLIMFSSRVATRWSQEGGLSIFKLFTPESRIRSRWPWSQKQVKESWR